VRSLKLLVNGIESKNENELIREYININDSDPDNSDYASPLEDIGDSEVQKIYYGFVFTIA